MYKKKKCGVSNWNCGTKLSFLLIIHLFSLIHFHWNEKKKKEKREDTRNAKQISNIIFR